MEHKMAAIDSLSLRTCTLLNHTQDATARLKCMEIQPTNKPDLLRNTNQRVSFQT